MGKLTIFGAEAPGASAAALRHRNALTCAALALLCIHDAVWAQAAPSVAPANVSAAKNDKFLPLEVIVNGSRGGTWVFIERNGVIYAPKDAFEQWRVGLREDAQGFDHQGTMHFALAAVPGFSANIDSRSQTLVLTFAASAFAESRNPGSAYERTPPSPVLPSVYLNYDLNHVSNQTGTATSNSSLGAVLEAGVSTPIGVFNSTHLGRNLATSGPVYGSREWVRLDSTFTKDFPEHDLTLRIGDSITRPGLMGNAVYYGGISIGSNYGLSPGRLLQPRPSVSGVSVAPSTVELYINNALRQTAQVPAGPFSIDNIDNISGGTNARLVVRDVLGRETVFDQSIFSSTQLLEEGLADWGIELGAIRQNYSVLSNDYGDGFLVGTYRAGVSKELTVEFRTEVSKNVKTLGVAGVAALPAGWLGKAGMTASISEAAGSSTGGTQGLLGLEYPGVEWAANFQAQVFSRHFHQLGDDVLASAAPKYQFFANVNRYFDEGRTSLGLSVAARQRWDGQRTGALTASYGLRVGKRGRLQFTANRALGHSGNASVGVTLILPLENDVNFMAGANARKNASDVYVGASHSPYNDGELGWRVQAGIRDESGGYVETGLYYPGQYGRVSVDVVAQQGNSVTRLGATGALVATGEGFFASQAIKQGFAVVSAPGLANIPIKVGGQLRGVTNADGKALITRLGQYQVNGVQLDANAVPVSADIDSIESVVVPSFKSGVLAAFNVKAGKSAVLIIKLADGSDAPAGASVQIDGQQSASKDEFFVGNRGMAYVSGLNETGRNVLTLKWKGQSCLLAFELPKAKADEVIKAGPLVCTGVQK
jgi:outer membrane usher protein